MDRRDFLRGLTAGAAAFGSSAPSSATALAGPGAAASSAAAAVALRHLSVSHRTIEVNGKAARIFGLGQPGGEQGLTLDAGGRFDVTLANDVDAPTLIHWHGLTPPWAQDGVPDNPEALLKPGESRRYGFPAGPGGTHWMHAHTLQEQNLLAAPLIVRTAADRQRDEQEVVVLLHDFSFTPAEELLARLQRSDAAGHAPATTSAPHAMGHGAMPPGKAHAMPGMPAQAAMDLNDIDYDAYLANDRTLDDPQVVPVEKGGRVRLRIINGAPLVGAVRDTVLVPPEARVSIAFDADNPGRWPLHCHHLYHMAAGMMAFVDYVS